MFRWWPDAAPTPSAQKSGLAGICKNIYGTDGTIFSNFVKKEARQWIYDPEMCRSFWIDFDTETEVFTKNNTKLLPVICFVF